LNGDVNDILQTRP